jgi:hypothetical protein
VVEGGVDLLVWQTNTTFGAGDGSTLPVASTNAVSTTPQDFLRVKVTQP